MDALFSDQLHAIRSEAQSLSVADHREVEIDGLSYREITLDDGVIITSDPARENERRILGRICEEKGLDRSYAKALTDAVVRYRYPHTDVPTMEMPYADGQKRSFHLQHKDLPQLDPALTEPQKAFLRSQFEIAQGWTVFDIGCFYGHGTVRTARKVGATGKVIAVEAIPANRAVAAHNLDRNGIDNVSLHHAGIWSEKGTKAIQVSSRQANSFHDDVVHSDGTITIPTLSLLELTKEAGKPADLVTLTVNGAEVEAIEALSHMDRSDFPHRIIMPGWYAKDGQPRSIMLARSLEEHGYRVMVTSGDFVIAWLEDKVPFAQG
ncbi:FkbM family methyltransferase [Altererythrobacter sp. CAU 1778]